MKVKYFFPIVGLMFLISCGGNNTPSADSTKAAADSNKANMDTAKMTSDSSNKVASSVSDIDAKFAVDAAEAGMLEIELGKVAQQNSSSADVKNFGAMMVTDHTKIGDQLTKISMAKHITLPSSVSNDDQNKINDFKKKTGHDFDKTYMDAMVSGHKKVAAMFEDEIKNGSDQDIRDFATHTLDGIKAHLQAAQKCEMMIKK
jgi:putative membrane protein